VSALAGDPFATLGLEPSAGLTDDDVRAAWRRIAAATHPDRADGGDPDRFAIAAAAYTELRTSFGRGEALASRGDRARSRTASPSAAPRQQMRAILATVGAMLGRGRSLRLAVRVIVAAAAATVGVLAGHGGPAGPALVTGAMTWLILTGRHDLRAPANHDPRAPTDRG
jgi:hypothetical protein